MARVILDSLKKTYGGNLILNNISTVIEDGELVSLLGPSGCGKTTTLRCIAGFEIPDSGTITIGDTDITTMLPEQRDIGMVFQNYALFPHMTVFDNVAFGLRMRKVPREEITQRVHQIMKVVGLEGYDARYPRMLSGGQQQRVAIARALVIRPRLLLLDEPLANLDAKLREEMRFYLKKLQKEVGITMIYVTHDQSEALVLSDRIIVMFNGRIHQCAAPEELYRHPATLSVANFIGLINPFDARFRGLENGCALAEASCGVLCCENFIPEQFTGMAPDTPVKVGIRPESLTISSYCPEKLPGLNIIGGTVKEKVYIGNMFDYRVATSGGEVVRVQASPSVDIPMGSSCWISAASVDTLLLPLE